MNTPQSEKPDNVDLLIKFREGDEPAFIQIYNQYRGKVYSYAYQLCKSADTAEEIVQEVFIKIWQKREQINVALSFNAYLKKNHIESCPELS